jgi:formylmethanofuran dehydrogenase subunit C
MSALTLRLEAVPDQRVDLSRLVPDALQRLSENAIARLPIHTTRRRLSVGDVFTIRMGDPASLCFEGGSERFDHVGAGMGAGEIVVEGKVGQQAGRLMGGGRLHIRGNTGPYAASRMAGGLIEIDGDAGERLGAPLAGEMAGMSGGVAIVRGNAGAHAGDRLRRGLIVVEGESGAHAGSRLLAGTLVLRGRVAATPGSLMRRGTIVALADHCPISPGFVDCGSHRLIAMRLLAAEILRLGCAWGRRLDRPLRRFAGDMAELGKGEILCAPGEQG